MGSGVSGMEAAVSKSEIIHDWLVFFTSLALYIFFFLMPT